MKIRNRKVCHTCRARKLGCDGKTPACSQCRVRGYQCAGYQHHFIFKDQTPASVIAKPPQRRHTAKDSTRLSDKKAAARASYSTGRIDNLGIPHSLSWTLLDMISLLVQNFSPVGYLDGSTQFTASPPRICGAWIEVLPQLANNGAHEQVLASAVKSLAISILAQGSKGRAPLCDALRAYGLALRSLRNGLSGGGAFSNVFVAATMCLTLAQLMLPTCDTSAMIHVKGLEDLMELCSPDSYVTGDSHKLFAGFRPVLIVQSLVVRRPNFVSTERWNAKPFSLTPMNQIQILMTQATPLPSILGRLDDLKSAQSPEATQMAQDALDGLLETLECLAQWKNSEISSYGYTRLPSGTPESPAAIWFPDITVANCFTHFWAFWIMCTDNIARLKSHFPDLVASGINVDGQDLDSLLDPEKAIAVCGEILQGVEFLIRDEFKLYGVASTTLPINIACEALDRHGDRGAQMLARYKRVFDEITGKGYYFLSNLKAHSSPK